MSVFRYSWSFKALICIFSTTYLCNKNVENCILMKTLMFSYFEHICNLVEKLFSIGIRTKLKFLKMLQVEGRLKEICSFET